MKNRILLIEAEAEVLKHKYGQEGSCDVAISKFYQSMEESKRQGIIHEEAYAHERCAIAMLEWGQVTQAIEYFERAKNLYEEWGSNVKVAQLIKYVEDQSGVKLCQN